ncbi:MAG: extracellular solute-binding protein, partial [Lachnospiraceae bacterium]
QTGLEYLEEINDASVRQEEDGQPMPDLYIINNDSLEKAYLAGLAAEIKDEENFCTTQNYPQTALDAVSYNGKRVAYPFYFETSALLYNKTYMDETELTIPDSIDGILTFADEYDAPEQVEAVFKWDVSDIFYNYYFTGNYMIVGGPAGDDPAQVDIDNENTRRCLKVYQDLNQFFSIDTKEVTYDSVIQDFLDGKVVMTVATSDVLARLEAAKAAGEFEYEYGLTKMPDLSESLKGRSLSVTNGVVVNGYSEKSGVANDFAKYLVYDRADSLYDGAGKIPARSGLEHELEGIRAFEEEYAQSIPMPKMLGTSNFWVQLEICYAKIWQGEEIDAHIQQLDAQIREQLGGE